MKSKITISLAITTLASSAFALIDFEGIGLTDNAAIPFTITDSDTGIDHSFWFDNDATPDSTFGFGDVLMEAELVGDADPLPGFFSRNVTPESFDQDLGGSPFGLQDWFIKNPGTAVTNDLVPGASLIISFMGNPVLPTSAFGEVWDVDKRPADGTYEEWTVTAYDAADDPLTTVILSAAGDAPEGSGAGDDSRAKTFSFNESVGISYISVSYTGTAFPTGLGFDNFSAIPEPSAGALFGLVVLLAARRRA